MALASDDTRWENIPHEPENSIEFRELGYADLEAARRASASEGRSQLREMGPELYEVVQRRPQSTVRNVVDPINTHDRMTLLDRGIVAWSYQLHLPERSGNQAQQEERLRALGKLDDRTVEWAARFLMANAGVRDAWGVDSTAIEATARRVDDEDDPSRFPTNSGSSLRSIA
jgi:hypothetical protein